MNDEVRWLSLAAGMHREVAAHFPDWTDTNDHDPGITLLNVFSWLTERLLYEQAGSDHRFIAAARRLAAAASVGSNANSAADSASLLRVNYFAGQLLGADDFRDEQSYFRQRLRRLNQRLHGQGVVSGLAVSIKGKASSARIEIAPGIAVDGRGEEIVVASTVTLPLPSAPNQLCLQLRWVERPCRPIPAADNSAPTQHSRIADAFEAVLSPVAAEDSVTLAHLKRSSGRWTASTQKKRRRRRT